MTEEKAQQRRKEILISRLRKLEDKHEWTDAERKLYEELEQAYEEIIQYKEEV